MRKVSASLWGCELKYGWIYFCMDFWCQPPCEAVSWNVDNVSGNVMQYCQPPCEAVSWNSPIFTIRGEYNASASLWGCELKSLCRNGATGKQVRQPPCEAVSWNLKQKQNLLRQEKVSLLARLWVERTITMMKTGTMMKSSYLRGWELKCYHGQHEEETGVVSLTVRLWIEKKNMVL